jgi:nucleosome binding factor SPN SPT16 subunit
MGYSYREKDLLLNIRNQTLVENGMCFNLVVSLENVETGRPFKISMQIADMILTENNQSQNLT